MINAYYNGFYLNTEDVKIPLTDRSIFFGDGVYDAAAGRNGKIYLENEHLNRFTENSKKLNLPLPIGYNEISGVLHSLIEKSGLSEYFIYFHTARQSDGRNHVYKDTDTGNFLATVKPHKIPPCDKALKLITVDDVRYFLCNVKTLNLLPNVLASKKAEDAGCDEAVFIRDGYVTECSHSNVLIIKNGTLITHPNGKYILPGIMRGKTIEICKKLGITTLEKAFTKEELYEADEILVSSTTRLCLLASEIDGIRKEITKNSLGFSIICALRDDFLKMTAK